MPPSVVSPRQSEHGTPPKVAEENLATADRASDSTDPPAEQGDTHAFYKHPIWDRIREGPWDLLGEESGSSAAGPEGQSAGMPLFEDIREVGKDAFDQWIARYNKQYLVETITSVFASEEDSDTKLKKLNTIMDVIMAPMCDTLDICYWKPPALVGVIEKVIDSIGGNIRVLAGFCPGAKSSEKANSAKYDIVKPVTPDFAYYLTHWVLHRPIFEAAIWHTVIAEFFEAESAVWVGRVGKDFNRLCNEVEGYVMRSNSDYNSVVAKFHESRARLAFHIVQEVWKPGDFNHEDTRETFAEKERLAEDVILKRFRPFINEDTNGKAAKNSAFQILKYAAILRRELEQAREVFKLVMANGLDDSRQHFDYNSVYMEQHWTDKMSGPLPKDPPKVAFVVSPMLVKRGHSRNATTPAMDYDKVFRVLRSTVLLEDWDERRTRGAADGGDKGSGSAGGSDIGSVGDSAN
ncbi:hypothetical protein QBC33DRAFT_525126 [Phialemonium atrogriseum]|uniref:Uncharacterized protein n=1 Tax=Phialemonium atrogriseum TaxID=1093897 RepID=A0AAJ0C833_9PEZI|nr:uncharacterized protein QBC33DRAFT_525126 [Phialemonium atrogriseum]KAK1771893.1 hypothetical protein QBC33DRAFT_525126 [Phialemonium atrogriseum]